MSGLSVARTKRCPPCLEFFDWAPFAVVRDHLGREELKVTGGSSTPSRRTSASTKRHRGHEARTRSSGLLDARELGVNSDDSTNCARTRSRGRNRTDRSRADGRSCYGWDGAEWARALFRAINTPACSDRQNSPNCFFRNLQVRFVPQPPAARHEPLPPKCFFSPANSGHLRRKRAP